MCCRRGRDLQTWNQLAVWHIPIFFFFSKKHPEAHISNIVIFLKKYCYLLVPWEPFLFIIMESYKMYITSSLLTVLEWLSVRSLDCVTLFWNLHFSFLIVVSSAWKRVKSSIVLLCLWLKCPCSISEGLSFLPFHGVDKLAYQLLDLAHLVCQASWCYKCCSSWIWYLKLWCL